MKWIQFFLIIIISLSVMGQEFEILRIEPYSCKPEREKWPNSIFYNIFMQSFYDSNGDGIGDLKGVSQKLDYLQNLGVEAIWLLPIHPAKTYHKYDITNYLDIHSDYGTLDDFKSMVEQAHQRNIKVIIDLVANHTSLQHPWFQEALKGNQKYIDYYVWTDDKENIKKEPEHWHKIIDTREKTLKGKSYYGFFYHEMPDLNFDNREVREEIIDIGTFWLTKMNVDGFRLDAARYIYPEEQKEKNYLWWQEFRSAMQKAKPDVFLVGEIWGSDSVIAPYLNKGLNAAFNFDVSYKIIKSLKDGQDKGIIEKVIESRKLYQLSEPDFIDAVFLTNHDQERVMSEFKGVLDMAKVAASILLTLPGSPFIYYGEEIGMYGEKPDEYIREPFLWDLPGKNKGQTTWLESKYSTIDVVPPLAIQQRTPSSMYQHYHDLIELRKNSTALSIGNIQKVDFKNKAIVAYERNFDNERILIIHNITDKGILVDLPKEYLGFSKLIFSSQKQVQKKGLKIFVDSYSSIVLTY